MKKFIWALILFVLLGFLIILLDRYSCNETSIAINQPFPSITVAQDSVSEDVFIDSVAKDSVN